MQLLHYRRDDGSIEAVYESGLADILELNRREDDAITSLLIDASLPLDQQEQYEVREGQVCAKTALTLHAVPLPLPADGQTPCQVTVEPFVPCTLRVMASLRSRAVEVSLTPEDPTLVLTADCPMRFEVHLKPMPGYWAAPLIVEAQGDA